MPFNPAALLLCLLTQNKTVNFPFFALWNLWDSAEGTSRIRCLWVCDIDGEYWCLWFICPNTSDNFSLYISWLSKTLGHSDTQGQPMTLSHVQPQAAVFVRKWQHCSYRGIAVRRVKIVQINQSFGVKKTTVLQSILGNHEKMSK